MGRSDWGSVDLGGTIGTLQAGAKLRVAHWGAAPGGPGTVILVQGRAEFIEFYEETISDLRSLGFAVVAFDLRGQGGSDRKSKRGGHIESFRQYADDIVSVVRLAAQLGLPRPFTILAHSMGGTAALLAAPQLTREVERMVLTAPLLKIAQLPMPTVLVRLLAVCGVILGLGRQLVVSPQPPPTPERCFASNRLTSDPQRYARLCTLANENPDLIVGPPTVAWMLAAFRAMDKIRAMSGKALAIPTLFVGSGADTIVSTVAIDRFARSVEGGGLVLVRGARHQLLYERDEYRALFYAAFDAFVTNREPTTDARKPAKSVRKLKFVVASESPGQAAPEPAEAINAQTEVLAEPVPAEPVPAEPVPAEDVAPLETDTAQKPAVPEVVDTQDALARAATSRRRSRIKERLQRRRRQAAADDGSAGAADAQAAGAEQATPHLNGHAAAETFEPAAQEPIAAKPSDAADPSSEAAQEASPAGANEKAWAQTPFVVSTARAGPGAGDMRKAAPPKPVRRNRSGPARPVRRR